jgi:aminocarboxymuconate-semialdehyde decarboxylase
VRIDVHTHFYPRGYLDRLRTVSDIEMRRDPEGRETIYENGARVVTLTRPMEDLDVRLEEMNRVGLDMAVLSVSIPNVYFAEPAEAPGLCRDANEGLLGICERAPERFRAWASVPLQNPAEAVRELEFARQAGMVGVVLGTNIRGRSLTDPAWRPFFEACDALGTVIFFHPMSPADGALYQRYALAPLLGFINDTNVAMAGLIFDGFFDRYPHIRVIVPHLGGALPYLAERLDNGYRAYPECRANIADLPSTYLKRLYYDTVSFHAPALQCALDTVGSDHLLLGSDAPHVIGDLPRAIRTVEALPLDEGGREAILSGNAKRLLGL